MIVQESKYNQHLLCKR